VLTVVVVSVVVVLVVVVVVVLVVVVGVGVHGGTLLDFTVSPPRSPLADTTSIRYVLAPVCGVNVAKAYVCEL